MSRWPDLPFERWRETGDSLRMWVQIVGKFRLAQAPWVNHSWQATFYVTSRGLTTSLIPGAEASFEVVFDFLDHELVVSATDGARSVVKLAPMSVAWFHQQFLDALRGVGAPIRLHHAPNEVPAPVPFRDQTGPGAYDADAARDFWHALVLADGVFKRFRTGFLGKVSPVHFFWGSFDLAVTRFSGRPAPLHPGGIPALPDAVTRESPSRSSTFCPEAAASTTPRSTPMPTPSRPDSR
jgi:hypothetical protein